MRPLPAWLVAALAAAAAAAGRAGGPAPFLVAVAVVSLAGCLLWDRLRPDAAAPRRAAAGILVLFLLLPLDPARPWPAADLLVGALVMLSAVLLVVPRSGHSLGSWVAGHRTGLARAALFLGAALATAWAVRGRGAWGQAIESDGAFGSLGAVPFLLAATVVLAARTLVAHPDRARQGQGTGKRDATEGPRAEVQDG